MNFCNNKKNWFKIRDVFLLVIWMIVFCYCMKGKIVDKRFFFLLFVYCYILRRLDIKFLEIKFDIMFDNFN